MKISKRLEVSDDISLILDRYWVAKRIVPGVYDLVLTTSNANKLINALADYLLSKDLG